MTMMMRRILLGGLQRHNVTKKTTMLYNSGLVVSHVCTLPPNIVFSPPQQRRISRCSSHYAATPPRLLPVKAIEVLSLGRNNNNNSSSGRLTKILHSVNSHVEAGDVVAEITTTTTGRDDVNGVVVVPVATPQAGKITQILYQLNDSISVGDVLFHIDTDQVPSREQSQHQQSPVQELLTHLKENNGMITDAKMKEWMSNSNINNVQHLLAMAKVLRDLSHSLPLAVRIKGLDLLQHALKLQQKQEKSSSSLSVGAATVHMELGFSNAKLFYWDAAAIHLNHALALLEHEQQQHDDHDIDTRRVKNKECMALCRAHLATIARQRNDIDGCIQAFQEALQLQQAILQEATTTAAAAKNKNSIKNHDKEKASAAVAATYNNLGAIHYEKGDYNQAIQYYNLAIDERNKYLHDNDDSSPVSGTTTTATRRRKVSEMAGSYSNLAMAMKQTGDLNGALLMCQKALQLHQKYNKDNGDMQMNNDVASSHEVMGIILAEMRQFEAALEQYRAACKIHEEINMANNNNNNNNSNNPQEALSSLSSSRIVATMYNKIGAVYYQMKDYNQALVEHDKALDILNQADVAAAAPASNATVPPSLIRDLANTYNHIGLVLLQRRGGSNSKTKQQGTNDNDKKVDLDNALESHQTARKMLEQVLGKDNPQLATTVGSIGNVLQEQGKLDQALSAYREAHGFLVRQSEQQEQKSKAIKSSPDIAASHNNIGLVLARLGNFDEALIEYRAARQVFADTLGSTHPHTASCHFNIGLTLCSQQESSGAGAGASATRLSAAAREEFEMARCIWASELGRDHPQTLMAAEYVEKLADAAR